MTNYSKQDRIYKYVVEFNIYAPNAVGWLSDMSFDTYEEAEKEVMHLADNNQMKVTRKKEKNRVSFWAYESKYKLPYATEDNTWPAAIIHLPDEEKQYLLEEEIFGWLPS